MRSRSFHVATATTLALVAMSAPDAAFANPVALEVVAQTATAAPGGGTFFDFRNPAINDLGEVSFWSRLSGGVEGVYAGTASTLALVVSTGTAAPGSAGTLAILDNPNINDLGHVAFRARLAGVAASADSGIWKTSGAGPTLGLVALEGAVAPGTRWRTRWPPSRRPVWPTAHS